MPVTVYYEKDASLDPLKGKTIAVLGYGSQGHAHSLNLRDSGLKVVVAERAGTKNFELAKQHGFAPTTAAEVVKTADLILMTLPDEMQASIYRAEIQGNIKPGAAVGFTHGFNIHFGQIVPPANVNVIMIAPKGPGHLVRSEFERGGGVPNLLAIQQDATGKAKQIALAWAAGIGGTRAGVIETTFKDETETDLFGEQVVLCGGISALVKMAFETLVKAGYPEELAFFECMHELKLIVDLFYQGGIRLHALQRLQHRQVRRPDPRAPHRHRGDPQGDGKDPPGSPDRPVRQGVAARVQRRQAHVQRPGKGRQEPPARSGRPPPPQDDEVDRLEGVLEKKQGEPAAISLCRTIVPRETAPCAHGRSLQGLSAGQDPLGVSRRYALLLSQHYHSKEMSQQKSSPDPDKSSGYDG